MDPQDKEEKIDPLYRKEMIEELKTEIKQIFLKLKYNHSKDIRDSQLVLEFNIKMSRYNELNDHHKSKHHFDY
jgi:hypothetical protein